MSTVDDLFSKLGNGDVASNPANAPERFFDSIGLMRGDFAPVGRAAVGALVGTGIMWALRPGFAFDKDGHAKPWGKGANGTSIPWYTLPAALAIFCGVFI